MPILVSSLYYVLGWGISDIALVHLYGICMNSLHIRIGNNSKVSRSTQDIWSLLSPECGYPVSQDAAVIHCAWGTGFWTVNEGIIPHYFRVDVEAPLLRSDLAGITLKLLRL